MPESDKTLHSVTIGEREVLVAEGNPDERKITVYLDKFDQKEIETITYLLYTGLDQFIRGNYGCLDDKKKVKLFVFLGGTDIGVIKKYTQGVLDSIEGKYKSAVAFAEKVEAEQSLDAKVNALSATILQFLQESGCEITDQDKYGLAGKIKEELILLGLVNDDSKHRA